jgi:hypothetical protein
MASGPTDPGFTREQRITLREILRSNDEDSFRRLRDALEDGARRYRKLPLHRRWQVEVGKHAAAAAKFERTILAFRDTVDRIDQNAIWRDHVQTSIGSPAAIRFMN